MKEERLKLIKDLIKEAKVNLRPEGEVNKGVHSVLKLITAFIEQVVEASEDDDPAT